MMKPRKHNSTMMRMLRRAAHARREHGMALLFTLCILSMALITAMIFSSISSTSRKVAAAYVDSSSARILADRRGMVVTTTPLLRERDWGDFTGRYIPELKGLAFPDNVEKIDDMLRRAEEFLLWVKNNYPCQTVLAMGHGIINKAIQAVYHHQPIQKIPRMDNAECRVLML